MTPLNPYSAPPGIDRAADTHGAAEIRQTRQLGSTLVVPKGGVLPTLCVCCSASEELFERKEIFRRTSTVTLVALGPVLGNLLAKRGRVTYYICRDDLARHARARLMNYGLVLAGLVLAVGMPLVMEGLGLSAEVAMVAALLGILMTAIGLVRFLRRGHGMHASNIDRTHVYLEGVHPALLEQARQAE